MRYVPAPFPAGFNPRALREFFTNETRRIANGFKTIDNLCLPPLAAEPERLKDGVIVYADGVNWNPGSGAGFYGREAGAWVKL